MLAQYTDFVSIALKQTKAGFFLVFINFISELFPAEVKMKCQLLIY